MKDEDFRQISRGFKPKALLFDFYGTLVLDDEEPIHDICQRIAGAGCENVSWKQISHEWAEIFPRLCFKSHGQDFIFERDIELQTIRMLLDRYHADLDAESLVDELYYHWERPMPFPESADVLSKCPVPVCIISNVDNKPLAAAFEFSGLSFDLVITSENMRSYKPRPEIFLKALELLGMSSTEVLVVGDSLFSDIRGASELGIKNLWINRSNHRRSGGDAVPDYTSEDLTAILDILDDGSCGDK